MHRQIGIASFCDTGKENTATVLNGTMAARLNRSVKL